MGFEFLVHRIFLSEMGPLAHSGSQVQAHIQVFKALWKANILIGVILIGVILIAEVRMFQRASVMAEKAHYLVPTSWHSLAERTQSTVILPDWIGQVLGDESLSSNPTPSHESFKGDNQHIELQPEIY